MTIVMTILASDNARNRRRAKRAAEREKKFTFNHVDRVERALKAPNWRNRPELVSQCMPDVAIYSAGHRTKGDRITCTGRQKSRGRSIPLV
ncbi:hypothetical protein GCM10009413_05080 [Tatumella punctata]